MDKDMETGDDPKSPLRAEHPQPQNPGIFPLLSPFRARTADPAEQRGQPTGRPDSRCRGGDRPHGPHSDRKRPGILSIPAGQSVCTDPLLFKFSVGDILSLRFFPLTKANDINYIESEAFAYRGDLLHEPKLPPCPKTATEEKFQICCSMPAFPATASFTGGSVSLIPFSGNGGWTDSTGRVA